MAGDRPDIRDMFAMHTMFKREFALLPALVRSVRAGDEERARVVARHIGFLTALVHEHHHGEDESLWPRLLQRGPVTARLVVELVLAQHATLAGLVSEIERELQAWQASAASERGEALASALDRIVPVIVEHTRLEEERAMPLVEQYVTAAEYQDMVEKHVRNLSPADLPMLVGMLMYEGGLDVVPAPLREVMREAAPRAYAAHCQLVHGTATPPRSTGETWISASPP
jgi:hemerythrin-like domain-containing protein